MTVHLNGKRIDMAKLRNFCIAAGVSLPRGLGSVGDDVFTYATDGSLTDAPAGVQPIIDAWAPETAVDFGPDEADLDDQYATAVQTLRTFVGTPNASVTNTLTINTLKMVCRILLKFLRTYKAP